MNVCGCAACPEIVGEFFVDVLKDDKGRPDDLRQEIVRKDRIDLKSENS